MLPFDLHVLSMPPAFNLSQDQTLQFNSSPVSLLTFFYLFYLFAPLLLRAPTQFVFSILNEFALPAEWRILLISTPLSIPFLTFFDFL